MLTKLRRSFPWQVLAGDIVILGLVTLYGFASHATLGSAGIRMLSTFVPLAAAWLLLAPHLGAFDSEKIRQPRQLWRPFWAMVLAGPMAAWLRGVMIGQPILPLFVVILGGIAALGLAAWRAVYCFAVNRK